MSTRKDREAKEERRNSAANWLKRESSTSGATCYQLPEGVEQYKLEPGIHKVDIMPWPASAINPGADEGMECIDLSYDAHRIMGPMGVRLYTCRKTFFGKRCAACEWLVTHARTADPDLVKQVRGATGEWGRNLWLINDKPGVVKGIKWKVLDANKKNKGKGFREVMRDAVNTLDASANPFDLDGGMTILLTIREETFPGGKYNYAARIDFRDRTYSYPPDTFTKAPCLDKMIVDVGYDAVKKLLDDPTDTEEEPPTPEPKERADSDDDKPDDDPKPVSRTPAARNGKHTDSEPGAAASGLKVGMFVTHPDYGECEIIRVSEDGKSLTLEEKDETVHRGIAPSEVEVVPTAGGKGEKAAVPAKSKPPVDTDDDEDEDDSELEEEQEVKPRKRG